MQSVIRKILKKNKLHKIFLLIGLGFFLVYPLITYAQYNQIYGDSQQQYLRDYEKRKAARAQQQTSSKDQSSTQVSPQVSQAGSATSATFKPETPQDSLSASLIVVGPATSLYSSFGHITIRIKSTHQDIVYDLGVGQSGASDFQAILWGNSEFAGIRTGFQQAVARWKAEDREITLYPLRLGTRDVNILYHELEARVDGRSSPYRYDPFRENCSTQLRQVLDSITQGLISRVGKQKKSQYTFRDQVNIGYAHHSLVLTLTQLWGGVNLDQARTMWEMSAVPSQFIELLKIIRVNGESFILAGRTLYHRRGGSIIGGVKRYLPVVWMMMLGGLLLAPLISRYRAPQLEALQYYQHLFWLMFRFSVLLLGVSVIVALILTLNSRWLEVRYHWIFALSTPFDLILLSITSRTQFKKIQLGKSYLVIRGVISLLMIGLMYLNLHVTPPFALIIFILSAWLTCFWSLGVLESKSQREVYERSLELDQLDDDDFSWISS